MKPYPLLILTLSATSAMAETPTVTVAAQRPKSPVIDVLEQRTQDVAGATAFLNAESWANRRAITLKDMVDFTPGVLAQPRNGAESLRLSMRGSGLTRTFQGRGILLMQDGIPVNTADGSFEFHTLDPWLISNAQILKGANALEQGATQLGGSINLITPTGRTQAGYELRLEGGSFGQTHALLSNGFQDGESDGYIALTYLAQDGYRINNAHEATRLAANFGWQTRPEWEQRLYVSISHTEAQIPGTISLGEIETTPQKANPLNVTGHFLRETDVWRVAYRSQWQTERTEWQASAYTAYRTLDTPVTVAIKSHARDYGARLRYGYGLRPNRFTAGINVYYSEDAEKRFVNNRGVSTTPIVTRDLKALTTEAYAQYERLIAENLTGIAGLQAATVNRDIDQTFPTTEQRDSEYSGLNPRLGLRYDAKSATIFANLSRSWEPPSLSELSGGNGPGFKALGDQKATTAEVGARGRQGPWKWEAATYFADIDGEYIILRQPDGSSEAANADKTRHFGIELGLSSQITDRLSFNSAYTYSRYVFNNDAIYGDNTLPGAPEHYLRAEIAYTVGSFAVAPNVEWSPTDYPIDMANSLSSPGYVLWGLRTSWTPKDSAWSAYIDMRNLSDESYVTTTNVIANAFGRDGRHFYPGEGRAVYLGIRIKA